MRAAMRARPACIACTLDCCRFTACPVTSLRTGRRAVPGTDRSRSGVDMVVAVRWCGILVCALRPVSGGCALCACSREWRQSLRSKDRTTVGRKSNLSCVLTNVLNGSALLGRCGYLGKCVLLLPSAKAEHHLFGHRSDASLRSYFTPGHPQRTSAH